MLIFIFVVSVLSDILQVLSGRQPVNEGRVRRLIADYVEGCVHNEIL